MKPAIKTLATFLACFALAGLAEYGFPHFEFLGNLIWPGAGVTLLLFVLLHQGAAWGTHPTLVTWLDILFNGLILFGVVTAIEWFLRRRLKKAAPACRQ